jgi:hypothetical protein
MEISTSTTLNASFRQVNRDAAECMTTRQHITAPKNKGSVKGITVYFNGDERKQWDDANCEHGRLITIKRREHEEAR